MFMLRFTLGEEIIHTETNALRVPRKGDVIVCPPNHRKKYEVTGIVTTAIGEMSVVMLKEI